MLRLAKAIRMFRQAWREARIDAWFSEGQGSSPGPDDAGVEVRLVRVNAAPRESE